MAPGVNGEDNDDVIIEENPVDEEEYCAWNELRLHPIIMKAIYRLKFKDPTPIQKSCIPAAAHQGKVDLSAMLALYSYLLYWREMAYFSNWLVL